jgi:hypothetical protein
LNLEQRRAGFEVIAELGDPVFSIRRHQNKTATPVATISHRKGGRLDKGEKRRARAAVTSYNYISHRRVLRMCTHHISGILQFRVVDQKYRNI